MTALDMFPETQLRPEEDTDERYTPRPLFLEFDREFHFTIDVCATKESAKLPRFWTKADNALSKSWAGERVFCNPPYSEIGAWVRHAWSQNRAELVVMLLPSWTDRDWWEDLVEPYRDDRGGGLGRWERRTDRSVGPFWNLTTRFLRGRIRFGFPGNPDGLGVGSPNMWMCLLIWSRA